MSKICLLCGENETPDPFNHLCDLCFDNAGNYLETNVQLIAALPYLLDAAYVALDEIEQWDEIMGGSDDPRTAVALDTLRDAIRRAEESKPTYRSTSGKNGDKQANERPSTS